MQLTERLPIYLQYFKYVMEHKKNVAKTCFKRGIAKHALPHDLSKLSLSEFKQYALYFYKDKEKYRDAFEKAWEHHYKSNPHHWEHWVDENNNPIDIPVYHIACMVADWEAMSLKFGDTPQAFYLQNYYKFKFTYDTRMWVEYMLGINLSMVHNCGHTLEDLFMKQDQPCYLSWREKENKWLIKHYGVDILNIFTKHMEEEK